MKKIILCLSILLFILTITSCNKKDKELEKLIKEYRDSKIIKYQEENTKYNDFEVDIAFIGDSLTDGYDVEKYYPDYKVSNRGIGGDTTFDLEKRLQVSVYDLKPKVVVMLIGANNFKTMFDNYENILKGLKENLPNTKIVLLSLTSMSKEWGKNNQIAAYNNVKIKKLAEKYTLKFVDLYYPLLNIETGEIYEEYTTDGGHLTEAGYEVLTKEITPVVKEELITWHYEQNVV